MPLANAGDQVDSALSFSRRGSGCGSDELVSDPGHCRADNNHLLAGCLLLDQGGGGLNALGGANAGPPELVDLDAHDARLTGADHPVRLDVVGCPSATAACAATAATAATAACAATAATAAHSGQN